MENWADYQLGRYTEDARRIARRVADHKLGPGDLEQGMALLRTYLEIPGGKRRMPSNDAAMVQLAIALYDAIHHFGYWDTMVQLWPRLIVIAEALPDPAQLVYLVETLAVIKHARGEYAEAESLYESVLNRRNFDDLPPSQQAGFLHQVAVCAILQGRHRRAKAFLIRCIRLAKQFPHTDRGQYIINQVEGTASLLRGVVEMWEIHAYALNLMGNLELLSGRYDSAEGYYALSLQLFETHGEGDNLACVAYQSLGRLRLVQRQFPEAISILERGLAIRRRRQDLDGITTISVCLAIAYLHQGQTSKAEPLLLEAQQITSQVREIHVLAMCHYYLGCLENFRHNGEKALSHWQQVLELLLDVNMPELEMRVAATLLWRYLQSSRWHDSWQTAKRLTKAMSRYLASENSQFRHLWRLPVPI